MSDQYSGSLLDDVLGLVKACERAAGIDEREMEARHAVRLREMEERVEGKHELDFYERVVAGD